MEESPHEREEIDECRFWTGAVGSVALLSVVAHDLVETLPLILEFGVQFLNSTDLIVLVTAHAGWGGLVYACWIRSVRITGTALAFVMVLGVLGMAISLIALGGPVELFDIVALTGTWILNGLGIVWIVQKVRRIRAASNTDGADAAR